MFHQASFSFPPKTEIMSIGTGNTIVEFFSGGNILAEQVKIFLKNRSKYSYRIVQNILAEPVKISLQNKIKTSKLSDCSDGWQIGSGDETPD